MNGADGITPSNVARHGLGRDELAGRVRGPGHCEVRERGPEDRTARERQLRAAAGQNRRHPVDDDAPSLVREQRVPRVSRLVPAPPWMTFGDPARDSHKTDTYADAVAPKHCRAAEAAVGVAPATGTRSRLPTSRPSPPVSRFPVTVPASTADQRATVRDERAPVPDVCSGAAKIDHGDYWAALPPLMVVRLT